jgi:hypothetical protein
MNTQIQGAVYQMLNHGSAPAALPHFVCCRIAATPAGLSSAAEEGGAAAGGRLPDRDAVLDQPAG